MGVISRALGMRPRNLDIRTPEELDQYLRRGEDTWAKHPVTQRDAMHVSAFFGGVRIIAEDCGKLPFHVYRRVGESRDPATDTREYYLLHDEPNDFQSSQMFREYLTACAILRGGGYALKNVVRGEVRELLPLDPRGVVPELTDDFRLVFHVRFAAGDVRELTLNEVFYLPGFTLNGYTGVSAIEYARQTLSTSLAMERHAGTYFGNGQFPGGVFEKPGGAGDALSEPAYARLREEMSNLRGDGAHNALILEEGMTWKQVGLSNRDSQFLESRNFSVLDYARWLRLPPSKLAHLDRATHNNIEHQSIEYVTDTLYAWNQRWRHAAGRGLNLTKRGMYAELLLAALLVGDTKTQAEAYRISVGGPYRTRAEVRRELNLPDLGDPDLEHVITPKNVDAGDPGAPGSPAPSTEDDDA